MLVVQRQKIPAKGQLVGAFLILLGFAAFVVATIALVKGSLPAVRLPDRKSAGMVAGAGFALLVVGSALMPAAEPTGTSPTPTFAAESPNGQPVAPAVPSAPAPIAVPARPDGVPAEAQLATVTRHVDGDTLWLEGGTLPPAATSTVRLLEIDTTETGTPYAAEATNFLKQELPIGASVFLLADRGDTDRFGRYLRYLWKQNGEFFNEKAVRLGHARAVLIPPNDRFISQIRAAEAEAKAARRGLWAVAAQAPPPPAPAPIAPFVAPPPPPAPAPAPAPPAAGNCDPSYPDYCIPVGSPDLDCADIGRRVTVLQPDPHRLDGRPGQAGEPDGIGCESY
jgi:micrococcal nuclease